MCGWVKLHRNILDWEWYDDPNTMRVFIHCLIKANHKEKNWRGIEVKRGQFISSLDSFSTELKLSVQQIRTSLKKLKATNEITSKGGNQHTVFTVVSYDLYNQATDEATDEQQTDNKQITNEQQTDNKRVTATKNDKKEKNDKNVINNLDKPSPKDDLNFEPFFALGLDQKQVNEVKQIRKDNKGGKITQRVINTLAKEFSEANALGMTTEGILNEWASRGWKSFKAEWIQQAKSKTGWNGNKNTLVESGAYSQKTANTIEMLNNWTPPED